jgi:hypothetical protein
MAGDLHIVRQSICCEGMKQLSEADIVGVATHHPFQFGPKLEKPAAFLYKNGIDGEACRCWPINYCPFCGNPILINAERVE